MKKIMVEQKLVRVSQQAKLCGERPGELVVRKVDDCEILDGVEEIRRNAPK